MTVRLIALSLLAGTVPLAGCTEGPTTTANVRAPAAVAAGDPVDCVSTAQVRATRVHDNYTIDFEMSGGTIYRNTLPGGCPGLGVEQRFGYETTAGRLCSSDTITVLQTAGPNGPTCGLGKFVPVRLAGG